MGLIRKIGVCLLWTLVLVAVLLVTDQFFVRFDPKLPVLAETRAFWVDFRARLLALHPRLPALPDWTAPAEKAAPTPKSAEKAKTPAKSGAAEKAPAAPAGRPTAAKTAPASAPPVSEALPAGYVYADAKGELHFAANLNEVPAAFRKSAQPLAH